MDPTSSYDIYQMHALDWVLIIQLAILACLGLFWLVLKLTFPPDSQDDLYVLLRAFWRTMASRRLVLDVVTVTKAEQVDEEDDFPVMDLSEEDALAALAAQADADGDVDPGASRYGAGGSRRGGMNDSRVPSARNAGDSRGPGASRMPPSSRGPGESRAPAARPAAQRPAPAAPRGKTADTAALGRGGAAPAAVPVASVPVLIAANAGADKIVGLAGAELKIAIKGAAEDAASNKVVLDLIAKGFGVRRYQVTLARGHYHANKVVRVAGLTEAQVKRKLAMMGGKIEATPAPRGS